jgi:SMC interacting uncharacterized protein involved in chromosome segregation
VPDAGILRVIVDAAREAVLTNKSTSSAGRRSWELSGGVLHCAACGRRMASHAVTSGRKERNDRPRKVRRYFYYVCSTIMDHGKDACSHNKSIRAEELERHVGEEVSGLLKDPARIRVGLDAMIDEKRAVLRGDPEQVAETWLEKLAEVDQERRGYLRLAAKGRMSDDELDEALADLDDARMVAEKELQALRSRREAIEQLERDKDALLESYARMVPEELDRLTPDERHQVYRMLRLEVSLPPEGPIEVRGILREPICTPLDTS